MKIFKRILYPFVAVIILIQFIPANRNNPPVKNEPKWDSEETKRIAKRLCFDCHSYETRWPWYSNIAPVSWLIASHVNEGRGHFNMSDFKNGDGDEAAEEFSEGRMPLRMYIPLHPETKLTNEERQRFIGGLKATFGEKRAVRRLSNK